MSGVTIPPLPTVECPACHRQVVVGRYCSLLGWHWADTARREPCHRGEGARVASGPDGLRAELADEVTGR